MTLGVVAQPVTARGVPRETIETRLRASGVPRRFEDCRLATFELRSGTHAALEAARALAEEHDARGLVLTGPQGTGKTHLAVAVVARRIERWLAEWPTPYLERRLPTGETQVAVRPNLAIRFLVVPTFLDRLRAAARYHEAEDPLPELFDADLVVLDDLGREKATDWACERLYVLVNERYNRCLPTIVTSNYGPPELVERGYEALVSRLLDGSTAVAIRAEDYRLRSGRP